ncbi:MAG: 50S ribosomal protein L10 [Coriobacteriia bacterium]|nr:50S ribosomal protein L10 [Coriobacteriia bacterium]
MPNQAKYEAVSQIKSDLSSSDAIWIIDYRGLTVKEAEELRGNIREQGAFLKVYKNSLTELAVKDLGLPDFGEILEGPSAFVFATGDPVASAKALKDYARNNPKLELKGGLLNGQIISVDQVQAVADLPSREELIAKLLGTIKNPLSSVVQVLNGPMSSFARVLASIRDQEGAA